MEDTVKAVINFVYFCFNFPYDFIEKAFADEPEHFIAHIKTKLRSRNNNYIDGHDMLKFFTDLDSENQLKLAKWIEKNYVAFDHVSLKKSPQVKSVLRLMDSDYSYQDALKTTLIIFPETNKELLEAELETYI